MEDQGVLLEFRLSYRYSFNHISLSLDKQAVFSL